MAGSEDEWKLLCVVLQPPLDVLLRNAELPFSGTNSVVSSVQDNALLLFRSVLASNGLSTRGLLTISKYRCHLDVLLVGLRLAIAQFQWALPWSPHRSLDRLLPTFSGANEAAT